ncbi:MAG TPA: DUF2513 domain-containing protein [Opitutaceae bacterium]|nr:DUF2513 domain-containing protein [Opitutaceae bacterium]
MKRDMDLVRAVLMTAEDNDKARLADYPHNVVAYHVMILKEGGLLKAAIAGGPGGEPFDYRILGLTWAGHDFLDNARSDTVWNHAKKTAKDKGVEVSVAIFTELLKFSAREILKLPPG